MSGLILEVSSVLRSRDEPFRGGMGAGMAS